MPPTEEEVAEWLASLSEDDVVGWLWREGDTDRWVFRKTLQGRTFPAKAVAVPVRSTGPARPVREAAAEERSEPF
jgi:hypothetical protein